MSRTMMPRYQFGARSDRKIIKGEDLDNATMNAGNEVTIWSEPVPADKAYHHGYGPQNRESAQASYGYAEILADGTGTGTDGDQIEGDLVAVVTDSIQEDVLARRTLGDLGDLADAKSDARTDRPLFPELQPAASEDRYLELRIDADAASDGAVVANDSNVRLYYGAANV